MSNRTIKREYTYSRISLDRLNADNQESLLEPYRAAQLPIKVEAIKDVVSGRKMSGEGIQRLWEEVRAGRVSKITVVEVSRLGRNLLQGLHFIEDCLDHDVEINILNQPDLKLNTPVGKLIFTFLLSWAEMELNTIKERTKRAMPVAQETCKDCGHWSKDNGRKESFKCVKCGGVEPRFWGGHKGKCFIAQKTAKKVPEVLRMHDSGFPNQRIKELLKMDERVIARIIRHREDLPPTLERKWDQ